MDDVPKINDIDAQKCEGLIDYDECKAAITEMSNFKTPGGDGLPKEFYSKFFYLFGNAFVEMVNFCYRYGNLSPSQKECFITLLCKNADKKEFISFRRPISLY